MAVNSSYLKIIIETTVTFFTLLLLTRFLGKKQLSHCTFFNYVTGITVGSIAGNMVIINTEEFFKELTSLVLWCVLTVLIGLVSMKSSKLRILLDGEPTILIKKGNIDKKALFFTNLNIDDLTMMIRQQNIFSITEIDYAILEPNGSLSVLKKPQFQATQKSDLQLVKPSPFYIPTELIADGKVIKRNLKELGLNEQWLNTQLKNAGVTSMKEVLYAEVQQDGTLFLQKQS